MELTVIGWIYLPKTIIRVMALVLKKSTILRDKHMVGGTVFHKHKFLFYGKYDRKLTL